MLQSLSYHQLADKKDQSSSGPLIWLNDVLGLDKRSGHSSSYADERSGHASYELKSRQETSLDKRSGHSMPYLASRSGHDPYKSKYRVETSLERRSGHYSTYLERRAGSKISLDKLSGHGSSYLERRSNHDSQSEHRSCTSDGSSDDESYSSYGESVSNNDEDTTSDSSFSNRHDFEVAVKGYIAKDTDDGDSSIDDSCSRRRSLPPSKCNLRTTVRTEKMSDEMIQLMAEKLEMEKLIKELEQETHVVQHQLTAAENEVKQIISEHVETTHNIIASENDPYQTWNPDHNFEDDPSEVLESAPYENIPYESILANVQYERFQRPSASATRTLDSRYSSNHSRSLSTHELASVHKRDALLHQLTEIETQKLNMEKIINELEQEVVEVEKQLREDSEHGHHASSGTLSFAEASADAIWAKPLQRSGSEQYLSELMPSPVNKMPRRGVRSSKSMEGLRTVDMGDIRPIPPLSISLHRSEWLGENKRGTSHKDSASWLGNEILRRSQHSQVVRRGAGSRSGVHRYRRADPPSASIVDDDDDDAPEYDCCVAPDPPADVPDEPFVKSSSTRCSWTLLTATDETETIAPSLPKVIEFQPEEQGPSSLSTRLNSDESARQNFQADDEGKISPILSPAESDSCYLISLLRSRQATAPSRTVGIDADGTYYQASLERAQSATVHEGEGECHLHSNNFPCENEENESLRKPKFTGNHTKPEIIREGSKHSLSSSKVSTGSAHSTSHSMDKTGVSQGPIPKGNKIDNKSLNGSQRRSRSRSGGEPRYESSKALSSGSDPEPDFLLEPQSATRVISRREAFKKKSKRSARSVRSESSASDTFKDSSSLDSKLSFDAEPASLIENITYNESSNSKKKAKQNAAEKAEPSSKKASRKKEEIANDKVTQKKIAAQKKVAKRSTGGKSGPKETKKTLKSDREEKKKASKKISKKSKSVEKERKAMKEKSARALDVESHDGVVPSQVVVDLTQQGRSKSWRTVRDLVVEASPAITATSSHSNYASGEFVQKFELW